MMNMANDVAQLAQRFFDQNQQLAFNIETGTGAFAVLGFRAEEAINAPFHIEVDLVSHDPDIDLHALMDTPAVVSVHHKYEPAIRYFHGIIVGAERGDEGAHRTHYVLELAPEIARLDHVSDARIWQEKSVVDIASEVLAAHGVRNLEWRLHETHSPREYLTQIGETGRAFIERILGEEGIFYFFEHGRDGARMVLTDKPEVLPFLPATPDLVYNTRSGGSTGQPSVRRFRLRERLRSTAYATKDYTFHKPAAPLLHQGRDLPNNGAKGRYERFDYPGRYKTDAVGRGFADHKLAAARVEASTGTGETDHIHLAAGHRFNLSAHDRESYNRDHILLAVVHEGRQSAALEEEAGSEARDATTYRAEFTTLPGHLPYRPVTDPKPRIEGPQIATVTGPAGEEIYCDAHGRVKIHFPWDRHGQKNETSSCWVRVSQNWAGGNWGHMAIPRIGQEVVVEFLDGDADQPIITGRTYHATNKPPYSLPENKTRMTIKSQTHKGKGYNELRFEDEAAREEIFLHAQRDYNTKVERNLSERINRNFLESIGHDKASEISNTFRQIVGGDMNIGIGPGKSGSITPTGAAQNTQGLGGLAEGFGDVGSNPGIGNLILSVEATKSQKIEAYHIENVRKDKTTSVGGHYRLDADKSIEITAGNSITIKVGRSLFTMDDAGNISINGKKMVTTMDDLFRVLADLAEVN